MAFLPRSRRVLWLLGVAFLIATGIGVDAFLIEPNWIEVVRSVEYLPMVRAGAPDLTLIHLSDIHIGTIGYRERRAIQIVDGRTPT